MVKDKNIVSIIIPTIKTEKEIAGLISEIKNTVIYELDRFYYKDKRK